MEQATSLYDHLAVNLGDRDPDPDPGTPYTATPETVDNDRLPVRRGGFAPL